MPTVYARVSKIHDAVGRSEYLTDYERQENIVLTKSKMTYSWKEHSDFEKQNQKSNKKNNEALEVHLHLPHELSHLDEVELEKVCDLIASKIVFDNHDYQYAVHWNKAHTNFHMHILFSERENQTEVEYKRYKKDIWHDKDTHKLAKANSPNAILVHKKGDIQRNKDGTPKLMSEPFKSKNTKYKERRWIFEKNRTIRDTLISLGYDYECNEVDSIYLPQRKLYKGASAEYIEAAKKWNEAVKEYNQLAKKHLQIEPQQEEVYKDFKTEIYAKSAKIVRDTGKLTVAVVDIVLSYFNIIVKHLEKLKEQRRIEEQRRAEEEKRRAEEEMYLYDEPQQEVEMEEEMERGR